MFKEITLVSGAFFILALGQQVGNVTVETHPALPWQKCTTTGGCVTQTSGKVTLDANYRWTHSIANTNNCYQGNQWNTVYCPDGLTCAQNCALEGVNYADYGISVSGNSLRMRYNVATPSYTSNRVFLTASDTSYQLFKPLNQEFAFDVDASAIACYAIGAAYFVQMDADGGTAKYPTNKAGAKYGTGYCDSQCPRNVKFINGAANVNNWIPSSNNRNDGTGQYGSCCNEMDMWEGNSQAGVFAAHPCSTSGPIRCSGNACGTTDPSTSVCDQAGCDFNSYRMGNKSFYGTSMVVDTTKKFTIVTQFITDTGTAAGSLAEIRRFYVQDGKIIPNSKVNVPGLSSNYSSITSQYCTDQKTVFNDPMSFQSKGGLLGISQALASGMVLAFSLWGDQNLNTLWLDSTYPTTADPTKPGVARGPCPSGVYIPPLEPIDPSPVVTFSNIRFGDIGATFNAAAVVAVP